MSHELGQLFQSFKRLGRESGSEEGTGIGLLLSKRLVELMDGRIGATALSGRRERLSRGAYLQPAGSLLMKLAALSPYELPPA